ncbi:MAG: hypothetical protein KDG49_11240 [Geminicoccaceae bacterium]|nr:hypothetical protein [Geminicoccaceae bacterium]
MALSVASCGTRAIEIPSVPRSVKNLPGIWGVSEQPLGDAGRPAAPLTGEAAVAAGAETGALASITTGGMAAASTGPTPAALLAPLFLGVGLILAPVTAAVGAVGGAATRADPEEAAAAEKSFNRALDERDNAQPLVASFIDEAERLAGRTLADCGAAALPAECELADGGSPSALLRLSSLEHFEVEGRVQPKLRLLKTLDAEIRTPDRDGAVVWRSWRYRGVQRSYFELAADDARLLRGELAAAREALVAKAVQDIFLIGPVERHETELQPEGTVWTVVPAGISVEMVILTPRDARPQDPAPPP